MKTFTIILFSIWSSLAFGQTFSEKVFLYRIINTYENDSVEFAKNEFSDFIKTKPTSDYQIIAIYYLAEIAHLQANFEEAISLYKQVLNLTVPDSIEQNYKNFSTKELAEIYIDKKEYKKAIKYLDLTKKEYPYQHFCGNGYAADEIYTANLYAECYIALENYKKAIDLLSPHMFNNGLADNSRLVKNLYSAYLKVYTKSEIKNEFLLAEKTLQIEEEKINEETYLQPFIEIFNRKVFVPTLSFLDWEFEISKMTDEQRKQKCMEDILHSEIYQLAIED